MQQREERCRRDLGCDGSTQHKTEAGQRMGMVWCLPGVTQPKIQRGEERLRWWQGAVMSNQGMVVMLAPSPKHREGEGWAWVGAKGGWYMRMGGRG